MAGCRGSATSVGARTRDPEFGEFGVVESEDLGIDLDETTVGAATRHRDGDDVPRDQDEVAVPRQFVEQVAEFAELRCRRAVITVLAADRARPARTGGGRRR